MRILGIDPGFDRIGWAVIENSNRVIGYVSAGLIQTSKEDALLTRLSQLSAELDSILQNYAPEVVVVEELFFANNQKTVIDVAQARGVIIARIAQAHAQLYEYTPLQVKAIVAGSGRADKKAVEKMVRLQLATIPDRLGDDTLDAIAIALAYAVDRRYG